MPLYSVLINTLLPVISGIMLTIQWTMHAINTLTNHPQNTIFQNAVLWGWAEQVPKFPKLPSVKNDVCEALLFLCLCVSTGNEATSKHILVMCLQ